jgi:probable HAF family extracellular repeat protein
MMCLLALLALQAGQAAASQKYAVFDLGEIEPEVVTGMGGASGINNAGYVALTVATSSSAWAGYSWFDATGAAGVGSIGSASTQVNAISNKNWLVGVSGGQAFVSDPVFGLRRIAPLPGGSTCSAAAVNDAGQVVGSSAWRGSGTHAVLWDGARGVIDLHIAGTATGINFTGLVCGNNSATGHAFLWTPYTPNGTTGSLTDLGTLPGASGSVAVAINSSGAIVGTSGGQAFIWTPAAGMTALAPLAGDTACAAYAMNDSGVVVGQSGQRPVEWSKTGVATDLNTVMTSSGTGWQLIKAAGINAQGWIVGCGMYNRVMHGFLLEPSGVTQVQAMRTPFQTSGQSIWESGFQGLKDLNYTLLSVGPWSWGPNTYGGNIDLFGVSGSYGLTVGTQGSASVIIHTGGTLGSLAVRYPVTVKLQFPDMQDIAPGQSFLVSSSYYRDPSCGFTTAPFNPRAWVEAKLKATNTLSLAASASTSGPPSETLFNFNQSLLPDDLQNINEDDIIFDTADYLSSSAPYKFDIDDYVVYGELKLPQLTAHGSLNDPYANPYGQMNGSAIDWFLQFQASITNAIAEIWGVSLTFDEQESVGGFDAEVSGSLIQLLLGLQFDIEQNFTFVPQPQITLNFQSATTWTDPQGVSHTGTQAVFNAGDSIRITMPTGSDPSVVVTPVYSLANQFTNQTNLETQFGAAFNLVTGQFDASYDGFDLIDVPFVVGAQGWTPPLLPLQLYSNTFTVEGFQSPSGHTVSLYSNKHVAPQIDALYPDTVSMYLVTSATTLSSFKSFAGGSTAVVVSGNGMTKSTTAQIDFYGASLPLPATYTDSQHVTVQVPNKLLLFPGTANLTLVNAGSTRSVMKNSATRLNSQITGTEPGKMTHWEPLQVVFEP